MSGAPAVLRFSRDRRGYEHFYLVQAGSDRGGRPPRILYWYRTPPGIKVGRAPFDAEMQRQIEAENPRVSFDWPRLLATPIPPPTVEVDRWRERRQAERAEKAARAARRADEDPNAHGEPADHDEPAEAEVSPPHEVASSSAEASVPVTSEQGSAPEPPQAQASQSDRPGGRRRRRRRRGRRPGAPAASSPGVTAPPADKPETVE